MCLKKYPMYYLLLNTIEYKDNRELKISFDPRFYEVNPSNPRYK